MTIGLLTAGEVPNAAWQYLRRPGALHLSPVPCGFSQSLLVCLRRSRPNNHSSPLGKMALTNGEWRLTLGAATTGDCYRLYDSHPQAQAPKQAAPVASPRAKHPRSTTINNNHERSSSSRNVSFAHRSSRHSESWIDSVSMCRPPFGFSPRRLSRYLSLDRNQVHRRLWSCYLSRPHSNFLDFQVRRPGIHKWWRGCRDAGGLQLVQTRLDGSQCAAGRRG
jgi:hypothetical protein